MTALTTLDGNMFLVWVTLFSIVALIGIYAETPGSKSADADRRREEPQKEAEPLEKVQTYTYVIPELSPAEKAFLAANREALRLNMDAMEAQRLLLEAAQRHEHDPAADEWYVDAEWKV